MSESSARERAATPWSPADLTVSVWPVIFGVVLVGWSWWEASGTASLDDQTGWVVVAVLATGVGAFGMSAWVRAGRRAVRERRGLVLAALEALTDSVVTTPADELIDSALVTYENAQRYHRRDCILVQGKQLQAVSHRYAAGSATRRCEMCEP